jgi:hypothetical protein
MNPLDHNNSAISIGVAYLIFYLFFAPSFAFLYGFWDCYSIRFYEYLDINQIVKLNIPAIFMIIIAGCYGYVITKKTINRKENIELLICGLLIGSLLMIYFNFLIAAAFVGFLIICFFCFRFKYYTSFAVLITIVLPVCFMEYGIYEAKSRKVHNKFEIVQVATINGEQKLRYLGKLNQFYFFLPMKEDNVFIMPDKNIISLKYEINQSPQFPSRTIGNLRHNSLILD